MERLHKALARAGVASRRVAETLIAAGRVRVNGEVVTALGTQIDPGRDAVDCDGQRVVFGAARTYLVLHKPTGYVTTCADERERLTVLDLLPPELRHLHPVGRLDADTEGLLLLTDDGAFTQRLTHPRYEVEKTYRAKVSGHVGSGVVARLAQGLVLEDGPTATCRVRLVNIRTRTSEIELVLHEGRKRQVRRMLAAVGHPVLRLRRIRVGGLTLGTLPVGKFRHLTEREVSSLTHD